MPARWRAAALAIGLGAGLAACAPAPVKEAAPAPARVWPAPPQPARIEYLRTFDKPDDFQIRKGFLRRIADFLFGAADERLVRPTAVVAVRKTVFVADSGVQGVHRYDPVRGEYRLITAADEAPLPSPVGLAICAKDEVYVADSSLDAIFVIRPGTDVAVRAPIVGLHQPTGIACDPATGRLWVADTGSHRILVFDRDGKAAGAIGERGIGDGQFNFPTLLWRDGRGRLYVTDTLNFRIQVLDESGKFLRSFGKAGDSGGDTARPKGVAADSLGHVYVVDALFAAFQIFDAQGRYLLSVGNMGQAAGEFWLPTGIFVTEDNTIYVADTHNRRVQVFRYVGGPT